MNEQLAESFVTGLPDGIQNIQHAGVLVVDGLFYGEQSDPGVAEVGAGLSDLRSSFCDRCLGGCEEVGVFGMFEPVIDDLLFLIPGSGRLGDLFGCLFEAIAPLLQNAFPVGERMLDVRPVDLLLLQELERRMRCQQRRAFGQAVVDLVAEDGGFLFDVRLLAAIGQLRVDAAEGDGGGFAFGGGVGEGKRSPGRRSCGLRGRGRGWGCGGCCGGGTDRASHEDCRDHEDAMRSMEGVRFAGHVYRRIPERLRSVSMKTRAPRFGGVSRLSDWRAVF